MNRKTIAAVALLSIHALAQQDVPPFFRTERPRRMKITDPIREIGGTNYFVENLINLRVSGGTPKSDWRMISCEVLLLDGTDLICENGISRQTIILKNYPKAESTTAGTRVITEALLVGTAKRTNRFDKVSVVDVWDYGTPVTEAELKAKPLPKRATERQQAKTNP